MSGDSPPNQQHVGLVSGSNGAQNAVGVFYGNVQFGNTEDRQNHSENAASACRRALFLTDPYVDRESIVSAKGTRVAGTCEWITHNESYRSWLGGGGGDSHLLWISGGPGKGKTMMSVFLTEELEKRVSGTDDAQSMFYFCSHQDEKRNTGVALLRGLVHQMVTKRPGLVQHALCHFETREMIQQTLSSLETLWIIFSKLVRDPELGTMFCVLDGLDECEEGVLRVLVPRVVSLLASAASSSTSTAFRLAIVSRDIPGLHGCTRVKLDPDNNEKVASDIERFISARVEELSRIVEGFNDEIQTHVQTTLLEGAEGTFLWVGFAMHELSQKKTCSDVLEALDSLPSGLPAIYSRMLLQIPAKQRRTNSLILRWVTMASRPLQLQELAAAIGLQPSSHITLERRIRDAIAVCGPFLKVQEQEVSLVHQSARDYLLRKGRAGSADLEEFRIEPERAHLELARTCLDCIAQSSLQRAVVNLNNRVSTRESPLLQYAALHWPEHAKSCSALAAGLFDSASPFVQKVSPLRQHWWESYKQAKWQHWRDPQLLLHMACYIGIVPWVEAVLAKKSWTPRLYKRVNEKDNYGRTALHWAVMGHNEAIVRLLVNSGVDVEAKDSYGRTALHWAAGWGHESEVVVRLLVNSRADVEAKDNAGQTALHYAVRWGYKSEVVVRLLVKSGVDIEAKDKTGRTALHSAVRWGYKSEVVVRLLVKSGADVKVKDDTGRTALDYAIEKKPKDEAVVRLLEAAQAS